MMIKSKFRVFKFTSIFLLFLTAAALFNFYQSYKQKEIALQIGCIQSEEDLYLVRSLCKTLLFYTPWTKEQIEEINNFSTVHIAIQEASTSPVVAEEYLNLFLRKGANINAQSKMGLQHDSKGAPIPSGFTALHMSANGGQVEEVALLIKYGADKSIKDYQDRTALDLAKKKSIEAPNSENYRKIITLLES